MKKKLLAASSFAVLISCSTPKYTYFDYTARTVNSAKAGEIAEMRGSSAVTDRTALNSSIHDEDLVVSTSKRIVPGNEYTSPAPTVSGLAPTTSGRPVVDKGSGTSKPGLIRTRKGGLNAFQEFITRKMASPDSVKEGGNYKNVLAITGFILVFTPAIWIGVSVFTPAIFAIGVAGLVSGIILSALGLRSKKKGFARAGLILGITEAALLVAFIIAFLIAYAH